MQDKPAILLLCTSSKVSESVREILENDNELLLAKNLNQAFGILDEKKPAIAILDFAAATSFEGDTLEQLQKHSPNVVSLLVCPRDKRDQLLESNLSNQVFRVLFATLSPGQTRLAVSAALKHAKSKVAEAPKGKGKQSNKKAQSKTRPVTEKEKKSGSKLMPIIAGVGIIALAGLGWLFTSGDKSDTSTSNTNNPQTQESQKTPEQIEIENLVSTAQQSFSSGILFPPEENNAVDIYTSILQKDANNLEAKKALVELGQKALGDIDLQIENGSTSEALSSMNTARTISANNPVFSEIIESQLSDKKAALIKNAEDALSSESVSEASSIIGLAKRLFADDSEILTLDGVIAEQQKNLDQAAELNNLVNAAGNAINENRLISPNRNNAQYFINRIQSIDENNSSLNTLKRNLSSSLLIEARSQTLENNFTQAKRFVDVAEQMGASDAAVNSERTRIAGLENRMLQQRAAEQAAAAEEAANLQRAEQQRLADEAAAAQRAAEEKAEADRLAEIRRLATVPVTVSIGQLTSINKTPPSYPASYQRRNVEGSATIGFSVQRDGSVTDVSVISVSPDSRNLFGDAAKEAVEQWSFEPYRDSDGNIRIADSQIRISFKL